MYPPSKTHIWFWPFPWNLSAWSFRNPPRLSLGCRTAAGPRRDQDAPGTEPSQSHERRARRVRIQDWSSQASGSGSQGRLQDEMKYGRFKAVSPALRGQRSTSMRTKRLVFRWRTLKFWASVPINFTTYFGDTASSLPNKLSIVSTPLPSFDTATSLIEILALFPPVTSLKLRLYQDRPLTKQFLGTRLTYTLGNNSHFLESNGSYS